jgi:hypothetical protein
MSKKLLCSKVTNSFPTGFQIRECWIPAHFMYYNPLQYKGIPTDATISEPESITTNEHSCVTTTKSFHQEIDLSHRRVARTTESFLRQENVKIRQQWRWIKKQSILYITKCNGNFRDRTRGKYVNLDKCFRLWRNLACLFLTFLSGTLTISL